MVSNLLEPLTHKDSTLSCDLMDAERRLDQTAWSAGVFADGLLFGEDFMLLGDGPSQLSCLPSRNRLLEKPPKVIALSTTPFDERRGQAQPTGLLQYLL